MSTPPTMVKQQGHGWRVFYSKVGLLGGADGVVCDKISPEILKSPTENVVPRGSGESDVKVQVVDADESEAENFLRFDQMSKIGACEILTRIAAAAFLDGRTIFRVGGIFEIDRSFGREGGAISG